MFSNDLFNARKIEILFAKKVMTTKVMNIKFGDDKDWDVELTYEDGHKATFEIKEDKKCKETGNVVFEYEYNGKPSGIYSSKADYIVYYFDDTFRYQDRGKLLKEMGELSCKRSVPGGDGEKSLMYLVPKNAVMLLFDKL